MARSFGLKIFEAERFEDLTVEQYHLLAAVLAELINPPGPLDRTVSIRTSP